MTKKLILITVAALGLLYSEASLAEGLPTRRFEL